MTRAPIEVQTTRTTAAAVAISVVVLSDDAADAALATADSARTVATRLRVLERAAGAVARLQQLARPVPPVEVVAGDWADDGDTRGLLDLAEGWILVLGAGEALEVADPVAFFAEVARGDGAWALSNGDGAEVRLVPPGADAAALVGTDSAPVLSSARIVPVGPDPARTAAAVAAPVTAQADAAADEAVVDGAARCPVCGSNRGFSPLPSCFLSDPADAGFDHAIDGWEFLTVDTYECRGCGASDRDRFLWAYLSEHVLGQGGVNLLEIAPSRVLGPRLRRRLGDGYRSADLFMSGVDDRVDITAMPYPDGRFDVVVCSHVLEHVPDDRAAMAELRRVLRPGGRAVLLVPISTVRTTLDEDPALTDPRARLARFGQDDHVRVYTRDAFVERLQQAGFDVTPVGPDDLGPQEGTGEPGVRRAAGAARWAVAETATLYVARPAAATTTRVITLSVPTVEVPPTAHLSPAQRMIAALPAPLRAADVLAGAIDGSDPVAAERLSELLELHDLRDALARARDGRDVCWIDEDEPEPLVTVRIPTFDRGPLVAERAIASALRQSYERLEVLVVGDGCDEATERAVRSVRDERVRFVNLGRRGTYPEDARARWLVAGTPAVNAAMDLARGSWIAPCDDDDELTPDHVEALLRAARSHRLEFVWSAARMEDSPGHWRTVGDGAFREGAITHGSVLFSAGLRMFRYRGSCHRIGEPGDWNLWRRMATAGVRMGFVDATTYVHYLETPRRVASGSSR